MSRPNVRKVQGLGHSSLATDIFLFIPEEAVLFAAVSCL